MKVKKHYWLSFIPLYLISSLPMVLMYLLSDGIYILLFYITSYRRKVVQENLKNSFPHKSENELKQIEKAFYKHLSDLMIEGIKLFSISKSQIKKRVQIEINSDMIRWQQQNQPYIIALGHYGNWEWAGSAFALHSGITTGVIYHPLSNSFFDWLMYRSRTRLGMYMISMRNTLRDMIAHKNEFRVMCFAADQTPTPDSATWITFLNQETAVFVGTEKMARKFNQPVVYATIHKINRGYYKIGFQTICEKPEDLASDEITRIHTYLLEKDINQNPQFWLWSHRRWKHKRKV